MASVTSPASPSCVIIIGMHRSGTSLLAGSLEAAGLHLGEVNTAAPFNKKGNRENLEFRALNDRIIERGGGSWREPPAGQASWSRQDESDGKALLRPYRDAGRTWGFKDPRTMWTLEGWLNIVPEARMVAVVRHPVLVARSLAARPGPLSISYAEGLDLWAAYNAELLRLVRSFGFPLLHFSAGRELDKSFETKLREVCRSFGLPGSPMDFFTEELVNQREQEGELPEPVERLYRNLVDVAEDQPC